MKVLQCSGVVEGSDFPQDLIDRLGRCEQRIEQWVRDSSLTLELTGQLWPKAFQSFSNAADVWQPYFTAWQ